MKLKKLISSLICTSLVLSSFVVVSANNVIVNESPISETNTSTSADTGWTTDESNLSDVEVTYQQSSNYVVTIPKTIALDSKKQATYSIKVTGDVDVNQRVYVAPVDAIVNTEEVDFYMKDQNSRKDDVVATVTQNKIYWSSDEVSNGYEETDNSISAPGLTSGTWKGTFQVEIKLQSEASHEHHFIDGKCECGEIDSNHTHNYVDGVCTICHEQLAGLFDANNVLLASWEESGIDNICSNAKDIIKNTYPSTSKVVIPNTVTNIYGNEIKDSYGGSTFTGAFLGCTELTEVIVPDSVITIGPGAFYNCTSLEKINIPNSVTDIEMCAFARCDSLKNIKIPNSVKNIGDLAFESSGLTEIIVPSSASIDSRTFLRCRSLKKAEICCAEIGEHVFAECTSLVDVVFSNRLTSIGYGAFGECTALSDVIIPDSVTTIGTNAFDNVPHVTYNGTAIGSPWGALSIN